MELPYRTDTLDAIPENARALYQEKDGAFVLPVSGVRTPDEVKGLETTLAKLKEAQAEIKAKNDADLVKLKEYETRQREVDETKALEEGRWVELREKLKAEHQETLTKKEQQIHKLAVRAQLKDALTQAGVRSEYLDDAYRALMEQGPTAKEVGDDVVGVFPDQLHGDQPIPVYVETWAKTDAAKKYLPPVTGSGGGAGGGEPKGGGASGKKYADMTMDEKAAYLAATYS